MGVATPAFPLGPVLLLAQKNIWLDPRFQFWTGVLVVTLFVAAAVLSWAKGWFSRQGKDDYSASDEMTSFRALYERGELSEEEYARVKGRLRGKLHRQVSAPPPAPARILFPPAENLRPAKDDDTQVERPPDGTLPG